MTTIKISHVVSSSSEDTNFPAENLTVGDTYKKWKCKAPGEKQASVILQLEKATVISSVDIGNEHSAFVEVLVGRSVSPNDDFQVLVVASSFMSPLESKNGTPGNRVRIFGPDDLTKPTCQEKWDRVKVVCTQPFNRNVQYGLSFVTLHTPEKKDEEKVKKHGELGRFTMKDDDDEEEVVPVGSLFARRKNDAVVPLTGAAAIRDASTTIMRSSLTDQVKALIDKRDSPSSSGTSKPAEKRPNASDRVKPSRDRASPSSSNGDSLKPSERKTHDKRKGNDETSRESRKNHKTDDKPKKRPSQSHSPPPPTKKTRPNKPKQRKPFGKLLDGVVFVLSGYQNPYRQKLRDMALEMGAKYKPDWCPGSTHLICAFPNTPKFQQVRGKGKIVSNKWIEECYSDRKQLPWRRYAVDRKDQGEDESDEEIFEDVPSPTSNQVDDDDNVETVTERRYDSGSDTEDEIERVKLISLREAEEKRKLEEKNKTKLEEEKATERVKLIALREAEEKEKLEEKNKTKLEEEKATERVKLIALREAEEKEKLEEKNKTKLEEEKAKKLDAKKERKRERDELLKSMDVEDDADKTDNDENDNRPDTSKLSLPYLPDFYKDKTFYLQDELPLEVKTQLNRYIVAFKGEVLNDLSNGHIDYLLADDDANVTKVITAHPETTAVTPDWVWKCNDAKKCLSTSPFKIK